MTESESQFELVEFEQVEAAPGTALLRVAGRPEPDTPSGTLTLVINDGSVEHRHQQLPALPGPPGLVRAAFSAPLDHVGPGATFSLALPDGKLARLPAPARRRPALVGTPASGHAVATPPVSGPAAEETGNEPSRLIEAERRAESRRLAIAELERRLQSERERRSAAESDIAYLRAERDEARAERDAAVADRDEAVADRDQAEARARAAAAGAGTLEAQIRAGADQAVRAQTALEAQLADRDAELERMRAAAEVAQARAHASRREVTALDEQLAHAQAQITVLQQALDEHEAELASSAAARDEAVAASRAETLAARERVTALEEEVTSLRELASRSDAQHTYDLETAQARLEVAHAELEVAHAEADALRHRGAELESTLAELDAALATRAAEIDLLRGALTGASERAPADDELEGRLREARAEASSALLAEIELLRAQVHEHGEELAQAQASLTSAVARADAAEGALAVRTNELEQFGEQVREQVKDVQRSREQLVSAAEATQHALDIERGRADAAEARNSELTDAVRSETERRIRAEEALIAATAQHALTTEALAFEAGRHGG